jgi:hypothetical protein
VGIDGGRVIYHPDGDAIIDVPHELPRDIYGQFSDRPDEIPLTSHQRVWLLTEPAARNHGVTAGHSDDTRPK